MMVRLNQSRINQSQHQLHSLRGRWEDMRHQGSNIKATHIQNGLKKSRVARNNHASTTTLLDVLTHPDLLGDQGEEDESERGRQLVTSPASWRVEMAQWIAKVREAEAAEEIEERDAALQTIKSRRCSSVKWKPITLNNLFSGTKHKASRPSRTIEEEEEAMEQAMAEALEDERPDDGAIEINSDEEYQ